MSDELKLNTQPVGDVTVIQFTASRILDEAEIQDIGEALLEEADKGMKPKLLLDFQDVGYMASAMLGKLVALNKKMRTNKGVLKLCAIRPPIMEVFKITKLHTLFDIFDDQHTAIQSFKKKKFFGR